MSSNRARSIGILLTGLTVLLMSPSGTNADVILTVVEDALMRVSLSDTDHRNMRHSQANGARQFTSTGIAVPNHVAGDSTTGSRRVILEMN